MEILLRKTAFQLLPEKAMLKLDEGLLLIADTHLGKAHHFRKEGISMPVNSMIGDYLRLKALLENVRPQKVYFLGDLFHSAMNNEWRHFAGLIRSFSHIPFTLIKGNHDIIPEEHYERINVRVVNGALKEGDFVYSHEPIEALRYDEINITGHVHPGIRLSGKARQSIKAPCFFHSGNVVILPAFGALTGLYFMEPQPGDSVYLVVPGNVVKL
jgi:uncharacterized protein